MKFPDLTKKLFIRFRPDIVLQEVNITTRTIYIRTLEFEPEILGVDKLNLESLRGGAYA